MVNKLKVFLGTGSQGKGQQTADLEIRLNLLRVSNLVVCVALLLKQTVLHDNVYQVLSLDARLRVVATTVVPALDQLQFDQPFILDGYHLRIFRNP